VAFFRTIFHRREVEAELDEEIPFHLRKAEEELIARGVPPEEARLSARRDFGRARRVLPRPLRDPGGSDRRDADGVTFRD